MRLSTTPPAGAGKRKAPRFPVGHVKGNLTVTKQMGYSNTNPDCPYAAVRKTNAHYYRVRCSCGTEEVVRQETLLPADPRRSCVECSRAESIRKRMEAKTARRAPVAPGVPDFLKINLRGAS